MFFKPTGTPDFLILCSGFNGSNDIFLSFAKLIDISMALLSCASSSCGLEGFYKIKVALQLNADLTFIEV